jgi:L-rhamnose mutarotase
MSIQPGVPSPPLPQGSKPEVFGMVCVLKDECEAEYRRLHADGNAGVRDLLLKYHMRSFSIFLQRINGRLYEFGTYSYCGTDRAHDMALLDAEPRNKDWLSICDPMQDSAIGGQGWALMERVYSND